MELRKTSLRAVAACLALALSGAPATALALTSAISAESTQGVTASVAATPSAQPTSGTVTASVAVSAAATATVLPAEPAVVAIAATTSTVATATPALVRLEDSDSRVRSAGMWVSATSSAFSGGAYRYTSRPGATLAVAFSGTSITVIGAKGPSYGRFEVILDGESTGTIDCYASAYARSTPVFKKSGLAPGEHRLTIRVLGARNTASTSANVVIDAFDTDGAWLDATVPAPAILAYSVQERDCRTVWHGVWSSAANAYASGGTFCYSPTFGAIFEVDFSGRGVAWYGPRNTGYGIAEVFVDGVSYGLVDQYGAAAQNKLLWFTDGLGSGRHRLTIKSRGERNPSSTGKTIAIDRIAAPAVIVTRYEHTASRVRSFGTWSEVTTDSASGGSYIASSSRESHIVVRFNGSAVRWIGPTGPGMGRAEVHLDGRMIGVVDQYSATATTQTVVWATRGLQDGQHALVIRVLGTRSPGATGCIVAFDAAESVRGSFGSAQSWQPYSMLRIEEQDRRLVYAGSWAWATSSVFSSGAYKYSAYRGSSISAVFTGTGVSICGAVGPSYGRADLLVDGVSRGTVDCYAPSYKYATPLASVTGLAPGVHTVKLVVLGAKNPSSTGVVVVVDSAAASGGSFQTVFDDRSGVTRSSGWVTVASGAMVGGTLTQSRLRGATMSMQFIGTSVALIMPKGPGYGRAEIFMDGRHAAYVDLYSAKPQLQAAVFQRSALFDGVHTLTVRVLGTRNAASWGTTVAVDGFGVTGERNTRRGRIVSLTKAQLNKQYVWAGAGPKVFDCSGLTSYAYRYAGGISLPHSSRLQFSMCSFRSYSWAGLLPGDLVFMDSPSYVHHVGMQIGYGLTINAPCTGKFVEYRASDTYGLFGRIAPGYWPGRYNGL